VRLNVFETTLSALLLAAVFTTPLPAADKEYGQITGTITYSGEVPRQRLPDNTAVRRKLLTVNRKTGGLQDVLVYLSGEDLPEPPPRHEDPEADPLVFDQENETFVPHLMALRDGQTVTFTNHDNANHNIRTATLDRRNEFNVYTGPEAEYKHTFHAGERLRPIRVGCDIHGWMRAWIYVFDHPWFAVTNQDGRFVITEVPPGEYTLIIRQPDVGITREQTVTVMDGQTLRVDKEFTPDDLRLDE
jgi:plastocyanin